MKAAKALLSAAAVILLLAVVAVGYKSRQGVASSITATSDGSEALDRLPSARPLAFHNLPTTNNVPEKDTYLGGRLYARPDGEVFTALGDVGPITEARTSRNDQKNHPKGEVAITAAPTPRK